MTESFLPKYPSNYPKICLNCFVAYEGKVIFLGPKNLETLKGYKVQVLRTKGQIIISLPGLSKLPMERLFQELEELEE